ncbi:disintegrin and metalloproteinase domain-containing protein 8 isoform X2 [Erinaceus europaeus]|uniref:Disintegrin and metalloproteinase domain-containing protein 8 isoform X2 n=1 Tax=Erinaceus europaeus TaxID=9365 RepID=A0ABM3VRR6_ERIEU|nr:disintegrin and metalloproteinase domain-containing protein 8 isoform X2 [Erinaceus europaeus]
MHSLGLWLLATLWLRVTLGEQFQVVWPQRLPAPRTRRALHPHTERYPESVSYVLGSGRHNFTLHLRKNRDLVGLGYRETYTSANGSQVTEPLQSQDHCFYQGHVQGHQHSAASLSTCTGLRGFFQAGPALHLIEPLNAVGEAGPHKLYQVEHLYQGPGTCGVSDNSLASILGPRTSAAFRSKNWPPHRETRFVELYVVTDYREFQLLGSREAVRRHVLEVVNHVDKLYQDLNFRVALVGLEMWNGGDKIHISPYANRTLDAFLAWQARDLASRHPHDNAQLITAVDFIGITVGLARVSSMCSQGSGAVNQDHDWQNPVGVASTMAHEMGHNLGLNHDENVQGCYCPVPRASGGCIMTARISSKFPRVFSHCSRVDLETFVEGSQAACLKNPPDPDRLVGGPVCGNGFLERGEQCDCGDPQDCRNHCCNATTCQLAEGAQCAQGSCCKDCKVMPAGQVCRPQRDGCDLEEHCDGQQPGCPEDTFQENGTPCPGGYCYDGTCPTLAGRCRDLWGPGARVAVDACFLYSLSTSCRGGLPQWPGRAEKCGVLFCEGGQKPLERTSCTLTIHMGLCQALGLDDGTAFEPVPEGTKCGHEQVCWKGRCQDFHVYRSRNCSAKCNGRGVCDHKQECHCLPGWVPPYCTQRLAHIHAAPRSFLVGALLVAAMLLLLLAVGAVLYRRARGPGQKRGLLGLSNPLFHQHSPPAAPTLGSQPLPPSRPPLPAVTPKRPPPVPPAALSSPPFPLPVYTPQTPQQAPVPPSKPFPQLKPRKGAAGLKAAPKPPAPRR